MGIGIAAVDGGRAVAGWLRTRVSRRLVARSTVGVLVFVPEPGDAAELTRTLAHLERQRGARWRALVVASAELSAEARGPLERLARGGSRVRFGGGDDGARGFDHPWIRGCDHGMLLGAGDRLAPDALAALVSAARAGGADAVYGDEAAIDPRGRAEPHRKPGWSPELLASYPYVGQPLLFAMDRAPRQLALVGPDRALAYAAALHVTGAALDGGDRGRFEVSRERAGVAHDGAERRRSEVARDRAPDGAGTVRTGAVRPRAVLDPAGPGRAPRANGRRAVSSRSAPIVVHVPRVLLERDARSLASPALAEAEARALAAHLAPRDDVRVEPGERPRAHRVRFAVQGEPLVSILVPTRDRLDLLRPCLASVERHTRWRRREIVVIDNGSVERETLDFLARSPHRVVRYDEPFHFSRLNNRAVAERARGEHLLFLNDDTVVLTTGWLEAMLEHAQRPGVGAVGAKLLWRDGTIQHAGIARGPGRFACAHALARRAGCDPWDDCVRNVTAVTAACAMVPRAAFEAVGGFDERFAVAYNDVDLCLRLRAAGYRIVYTPHAALQHEEGSTRGRGRQPLRDDVRLKLRWLWRMGPDPHLARAP
ncbi:MAG TPA: glycosyltransferase family 2 protein [Sandaracinaceae bacterium LLY-WYZ-13_1]|nr:glycosyltransferase family 2 protein [Sandaracinaceae bacterium LLY-WYZ-13_1]